MTQDQVNFIVEHKSVPYPTEGIKLVETHISWVLLADQYAYKLKKPVRFSFLDFSTLEKRSESCEKEVALNRRLAQDMYLGVLPVRESQGKFEIGSHEGKITDHAVWMKRMDETKQLDLLLNQGKVANEAILKLADVLADFHQKAAVIPEGEDWRELYEEFADVLSVQNFLVTHYGPDKGQLLEEINQWGFQFLKSVKKRIAQRNRKGFVIDGHGDLHCRNIFLMDPPVVFDCIEFNDDFRKLDFLNEIAFLSMDLERFGRPDLSELFCKRYFSKIRCIENKTDEKIFSFYKLYRANVRLKVHAINAQAKNIGEDMRRREIELLGEYLELYFRYFMDLKQP